MRKYLLGSVAGLVAMSSLAYALVVPPNVAVRRVPWQTTTHYRFTFNYNDANITNGIKIGAVPANSFVESVKCHVITAFNAGGNNFLSMATTNVAPNVNGVGDWVNGVAATTARCDITSATYQSLTTANGLGMAVTSATTTTGTSGGWDVWVKYYQSGTAATAGKAVVVFTYVADDDQ